MTEECTLPTAERPLRVAEWTALLACDVLAVERRGAAAARLVLRPEPVVAAAAADLAVREARCCSFFRFAVTAGAGDVGLEVGVPERQVAVLDGLLALVGRNGEPR